MDVDGPVVNSIRDLRVNKNDFTFDCCIPANIDDVKNK